VTVLICIALIGVLLLLPAIKETYGYRDSGDPLSRRLVRPQSELSRRVDRPQLRVREVVRVPARALIQTKSEAWKWIAAQPIIRPSGAK
jgi:hypothetical protein